MSENKEWVEVEVNPSAEAPKADVTPVVTPEEKEVKEPEEHYGQRARKRIQQLVGNVKDRDAELQQLREELKKEREKAQGAESSAYSVYRKAQEERMKTAEGKHQAAYDAADPVALRDATLEMIRATVELRALEAWERDKGQPSKPAEAPAPAEQAKLAPATKAWMDKNPWFGRGSEADRIATGTAVAISDSLVEEGYDPASEEFYQEVERRLVSELPRMATRLGREQETRKPVVAGQSRTPSRRIRLDEGTVKASARLGASLEDTARYMEKIQDAGEGYVNIDVKRGRRY